jgi:predicted GIY-YIG superfamily endonuclease
LRKEVLGPPAAIRREKQLKKWNRRWKIRLIEQMNPEWRDLFDDIECVQSACPGGQDSFHR